MEFSEWIDQCEAVATYQLGVGFRACVEVMAMAGVVKVNSAGRCSAVHSKVQNTNGLAFYTLTSSGSTVLTYAHRFKRNVVSF
jgi:hypothetical protein